MGKLPFNFLTRETTSAFEDVAGELGSLSDDLGVQITFQREDVFNFMYRL